MSEKEKITPVKLIASVLAAATAAVLSLRLNLVGTIVGAVLASVVTTLGAVFYQRSMEREKRWQVIAVGGVLVFVVTVLTMTSVQLVTGRPVTADPAAPSTSTRTETHTETTKTETMTVTVPPSTTSQPPSSETTTTAPSSTTESRQPIGSSTPSSTPDPIR
jgi:cytoskeletal protein RodZ